MLYLFHGLVIKVKVAITIISISRKSNTSFSAWAEHLIGTYAYTFMYTHLKFYFSISFPNVKDSIYS